MLVLTARREASGQVPLKDNDAHAAARRRLNLALHPVRSAVGPIVQRLTEEVRVLPPLRRAARLQGWNPFRCLRRLGARYDDRRGVLDEYPLNVVNVEVFVNKF